MMVLSQSGHDSKTIPTAETNNVTMCAARKEATVESIQVPNSFTHAVQHTHPTATTMVIPEGTFSTDRDSDKLLFYSFTLGSLLWSLHCTSCCADIHHQQLQPLHTLLMLSKFQWVELDYRLILIIQQD